MTGLDVQEMRLTRCCLASYLGRKYLGKICHAMQLLRSTFALPIGAELSTYTKSVDGGLVLGCLGPLRPHGLQSPAWSIVGQGTTSSTHMAVTLNERLSDQLVD